MDPIPKLPPALGGQNVVHNKDKKEENMSDVKEKKFLNMNVPKQISFLGQTVDIRKLSVGQVLELEKIAKKAEEGNSTDVLVYVIKAGCPEFKDYSDDEIFTLPIDELSKLSNEIMKYAGLLDKK